MHRRNFIPCIIQRLCASVASHFYVHSYRQLLRVVVLEYTTESSVTRHGMELNLPLVLGVSIEDLQLSCRHIIYTYV